MQARQQPAKPGRTAKKQTERTAPDADAKNLDPQAAWKQRWLEQADRRGAEWHALWKEALLAKRTAPTGGKQKKA